MNSVRNMLAIAGKELRSYFASPIAYVIIGLFALLFSRFFYAYLMVFVQRSSGMMGMGGGANNINQEMIRYVLMNSAVIILFVMPMITMRTYAEEKAVRHHRAAAHLAADRRGNHRRQVLRARWASTRDALGDGPLHGDPVHLRQPRMAAGGGGVSRTAAAGRLLHLGRPAHSSLTKNQIVAGVITFAVFLMLWIINWSADQSGPTMRAVLESPVDHRPLRRLRARHHRHQARRVLPELHHLRPVPHRQVGRQRAVARLEAHQQDITEYPVSMLRRIRVARMAGRRPGVRRGGDPVPEAGMAVVLLAGDGRPRLHAALHAQSVARDSAVVLRTRSEVRHRRDRQRGGGARHPDRRQLPRGAAQQALGPDRGQAVHALGADAEDPGRPPEAGRDQGLRAGRRLPAVPRSASTNTSARRSRSRSNTSTR